MALTTGVTLLGGASAQATERFTTGRRTVVLLEEDHDLPVVDLWVVTRTGSLSDPAGKEGLADLMAQMLRRGTPHRSTAQIEEEIDRLGARLTIEADYESIELRGRVIRQNLDRFAALLGELVGESNFAPAEIERARREAIAHLVEARDEDRDLARRNFRRFLFAGHPYGRPTDGTEASLGAIRREDLVATHRRLFAAPNVILGGAGDVSRPDLERLVVAHFAGLFSGNSPAVRVATPRPPRGRRLWIVDKPDRTQTQLYIGHVGVRARDPDYFPLLVGSTAFGGTFTARLMNEVRSKRGWSYGAYATIERRSAPGAFSLWTFPAARDAAPCVALELSMLETLARRGLSETEVDFARNYLVNGFAFEIDTAVERLEQQVDLEVVDLPADFFSRFRERVRAVTRAEVNEALGRRVRPDDLVIVVVATAGELRGALDRGIERRISTEVVPFDAF